MASLIKIKRSEVSGNPAVLGAGELAYSALADNGSNGGDRLYIGMGTETAGNAVNHVVIGGKYFTDQITAATSANTASTLVKRDSSGNFTAGTITAALSGNASTATKWATARNLSLTGDATATLTSVDGSAAVSAALTLATVNSNTGSFGSGTAIPIITVNAKGLITAVSTATISTALSIAGGTGTDSVTLGTDTLTFAGGTGVATTVTNNQVSFAIGQAVGTTDNVTFNNVAVNGTLTSDDITSANISVTGNATITGNLTVQGTTTTINSTTLAVGDVNIVLAKDATTAAGANGAGLTVNGPTTAATFTYTSVDDRWNLNKNLNVGTVYGALSGNATTATTLQTARTINGVSFDGSANITITAANPNALTIGTGLSGTSYNGSSAVTIAVDSTVALRADTHYIGTTAIALNRTSANLALTGISSVTLPGATSGTVQVIPAAVAGTGTVLTLPAVTGTVITTGDTATVTNTMLAGSIANAKLANSSVTVGTTAIALGASSTTLAGLTSVTSTSFVGALTGNASTATALATARTINGVSFDGSANITVTTAGTGITVSGTTVSADTTVLAQKSDTHYIGTTAVTLNRASANLALTGITAVTLPGATSGSVQIIPTAVAGTGTVLTLPAVTGTVVTTGDTGTVTNAMLAGSIANAKLTNSSVTVGSTNIALGSTSTTLAGLTSVAATTFTGALTGNADTATKLATARAISASGDATWTVSFDGSTAVSAALTLANTAVTAGSYGNGTTVPSFTVDSKGRLTAAGTTAIPTATTVALGLASFNGTDFTVSSGAVSIATVDGGTY